MNLLDQGVLADSRCEFTEAIALYSRAIEEKELIGDATAYLVALCWQMTEYGFNSAHRISTATIHEAAELLAELLDLSSEHARRPEVGFWRAYIYWVDLGDDFTVDECVAYLERQPDFPDPFIFIAQNVSGKRQLAAARSVIDRFGDEKTARGMYLSSVARSVLAREGEVE